KESETYEKFIERVLTNPLAVLVKRADLADNMDVRRLSEIGKKEADRLAKYLRDWKRLEGPVSGARIMKVTAPRAVPRASAAPPPRCTRGPSIPCPSTRTAFDTRPPPDRRGHTPPRSARARIDPQTLPRRRQ